MRGLWQLAISASATLDLSQKGEVSNCALLGPQYPMPEGLSTSSIINDMKAVFSKLVDEAISTKKTPWGPIELVNTSFSVGVFSIDSDEFLYEFHHHGPGLDGTLTGEALDNGTLYRIGSITKLLTVYTLLVKLGPSYWSQPIVKFIPELADAPDDDPVHHVKWSGVTLGALAGQMSGIARDNGFADLTGFPGLTDLGFPPLNESDIVSCGLPGMGPCTKKEALHKILQQDPVTASWYTPIYSNEAYQLLGMAYENITGESMEDAFNSAIKEPLGLSRVVWRQPGNDSNVIDVDFEHPLIGFKFQEDLGTYNPTGGAYASLSGLSSIGRSILRSSLLAPATTREWLKPHTLTAQARSAVGKPWEIVRMPVPIAPGSNVTRLADLYTKDGGIGAYLSHLILSPDHGVGVTVLLASRSAFGDAGGATFDSLSELLLASWIPAAEAAARDAAGRNLAGTYVAADGTTDSVVSLALRPGEQGLAIERLIYNGTDILAVLADVREVAGGHLHFVGLAGSQRLAFRAVWGRALGEDNEAAGRPPSVLRGPKCGSPWGAVDALRYGNFGLDEFLFEVTDEGDATVLTMPAFRTRLVKQAAGKPTAPLGPDWEDEPQDVVS